MSNRRQLLLDTALTLFIMHGYASTTIQMILDQSGVSKGTFYKFFNSKDDCFLAILEQRLQEDLLIRKTLETKVYASDFELLVDQIAIPMASPDKERVWGMFWTGFYSGEIDSARLGRIHLKWLGERLVQLYGEEVRPYAYEGAILFYGMLHQMANTWRSFRQHEPDWKVVVSKVLRYAELVLKEMHDRHEHLLDYKTLSLISSGDRPKMRKESLLEDLQAFQRSVQRFQATAKAKELTNGLLALLREEGLNIPILEAVLPAFQQAFEGGSLSKEARRIAKSCLWYLEQIKQE